MTAARRRAGSTPQRVGAPTGRTRAGGRRAARAPVVGNRAAAAIARRAPGAAVQRLVLAPRPHYGHDLYVPQAWAATKPDLDAKAGTTRNVTLGEIYDETRADQGQSAAELKQDLLANVAATLAHFGVGADANALGINVATSGQAVADTVAERYEARLPEEPPVRRDLATAIAVAFPEANEVALIPSEGELRPRRIGKALMLNPAELVRAPSDLGQLTLLPASSETAKTAFTKICALIAIVESEGPATVKGALNLTADADVSTKEKRNTFYAAMHQHYHGTQGVEYDEPASHPGLYAEWGYRMIFAGKANFGELDGLITKPLVPGRKYILDLADHVVFTTMHQAFRPGFGIVTGRTEDWFDFHSHSDNFDQLESSRKVHYIYEK